MPKNRCRKTALVKITASAENATGAEQTGT